MTHGSLFSGIGGFDLAAEWMGWENVFHCEWNDFGKKVLNYYWPNAISYDDITKTDFTIHRGKIDILTGGFPCQPYSAAGKRKGKEDERHLWPEMLRAIGEIQPGWIVGENVLGLVNWSGGLVFEEVCADLEAKGYEVQPFILPACSKDAPHQRQRVWFVAYPSSNGHKLRGFRKDRYTQRESHKEQKQWKRVWSNSGGISKSFNASNTISSGRIQNNEQQSSSKLKYVIPSWERFPTQPPVCSRNDGLSYQLDGITFPKWRSESIKAYGNAIVPQVVYEIFKAIEQYEV